jgi:Asp-tRNA(Asn)/Glu-tRNA(Gln) amidotransferase B subunit
MDRRGLSQEKKGKLVDDDREVDGAQGDDDALHQPEFAVKTKEDDTKRDHRKFPDPEIVPVEVHDCADNGVCLPTLLVLKDHHGEERVEDVQP